MARTGRDLNSERTESRKIKVETTFDGTRVNPEKSGSITQVYSENFTPEDLCYGVLKGMSTELYQMYMTIQNAFTFTKYKGYDPEVGAYNYDVLTRGIDNARYPSQRIYTFGLNLSF